MKHLTSACPRICTISLFLVLAACSDSNNNNGDRSETTGLAEAARQAELAVGAAVNGNASSEQRTVVSREFTSVTVENAMKWGSLAPTSDSYNFSKADQLVDFAIANGQRIRGHTLFWHRSNGLPPWLSEELDKSIDPAMRLQELMATHTATVVGRYAGKLAQWDVINEPLAIVGGDFDPENIFYQLLGEQYLDIALLQAHAADPSAELYINETFVEFQPKKFDALIALAQRLLDRGIPLHGLGLQGHFFVRAPDETILRDQLQHIAALGLKAEITARKGSAKLTFPDPENSTSKINSRIHR